MNIGFASRVMNDNTELENDMGKDIYFVEDKKVRRLAADISAKNHEIVAKLMHPFSDKEMSHISGDVVAWLGQLPDGLYSIERIAGEWEIVLCCSVEKQAKIIEMIRNIDAVHNAMPADHSR